MEILRAVSLIVIIILEIAVTPLESARYREPVYDVVMEVKEAAIIYPFEGTSSEISLLGGNKTLPFGDKHGKKITMTPELYQKARESMGQVGKHARFMASDGVGPLYRDQEPFHVDFGVEEPPKDLNMVFCRGKPIDFYAHKVERKKYMLYYYNL